MVGHFILGSGLNGVNGDSPYKTQFSPGQSLMCVRETGPICHVYYENVKIYFYFYIMFNYMIVFLQPIFTMSAQQNQLKQLGQSNFENLTPKNNSPVG